MPVEIRVEIRVHGIPIQTDAAENIYYIKALKGKHYFETFRLIVRATRS